MRRLVSPSPNLQLFLLPLSIGPLTSYDCSPAELSHKASAVFRRDAPPPGMQGLHER